MEANMDKYYNPFFIAGRIPPECFCDRDVETKRLTGCILNHENVVLTSPRRVGKTELIYHCFDDERLKDEFFVIFVDILHTSSLRELIMELGSGVFKKVARHSDKLMKSFASTLRSLQGCFGFDPVNGMPTFNVRLGDITAPEYTIEEIFEYLEKADWRCIVVIDEFQQVVKYREKGVEALLRANIQRSSNSNFIFSGSERRIMDQIFLDAKRPFYQSATNLSMAPIDRSVYVRFAQDLFSRYGKIVTEKGVLRAYDMFEGITAYVQRIMHDAFAETSTGGTADIDLVNSMADRFVEESSRRIREQLSFITEQQKELLYAIHSEGVAKGLTTSAFVKKHRLKSASSVQSATKQLLEMDLITKVGREYTISDPLLKLWLTREIQ